MSLVGVLYFATSTAFNAVVSATTVALSVSYGFPMLAVLLFGKSDIPPGQFSLGRWTRPINSIGLAYVCVITVFFLFPGSPSPNHENMNYAIAVLGVTQIVAILFWLGKGQQKYVRTEEALEDLQRATQTEVGGMGSRVGPKDH